MKKERSNKPTYCKYDATFKSDAVSQMKSGRSTKELSQVLGVSKSLLYK